MNETILIIVGIAIAAAVFYFLILPRLKESKRIAGIHKSLDGLGIPKHLAQFKYKAVTPQGCKIDSVVEVPRSALDAIDDALTEMIDSHRSVFPGWKSHTWPREYAIVMIEPNYTTVEDDPGASALTITAGTTAGTCIGINGRSASDRDYIVIPHQAKNGWEKLNYMRSAVFNEGEHCDEWANDTRVGSYFSNNYEAEVHPHNLEAVRQMLADGRLR